MFSVKLSNSAFWTVPPPPLDGDNSFGRKFSTLQVLKLPPTPHPRSAHQTHHFLSQERSPPSGTGGHSLLELSNADIDELKHEANWLAKSA